MLSYHCWFTTQCLVLGIFTTSYVYFLIKRTKFTFNELFLRNRDFIVGREIYFSHRVVCQASDLLRFMLSAKERGFKPRQ